MMRQVLRPGYWVRHHALLATILLAALAVRGAVFVINHPFPPLAKDDSVYDRLAVNMLEGRGFSMATGPDYPPTTARAPGYPAFLAAIYYLGGHRLDLVRLIQIICSVLTCALVFLIARDLAGRPAALMATALYGLLPAAAGAASLLLTEVTQAFLVTLVVYCAQRAILTPFAARWYIGLAVGSAAAAMVRPDYQFIPLAVCGAMIAATRMSAVALRSSVCLLLFVALLLPWVARNSRVSGRFIGLASGTAHHMLVAAYEGDGISGQALAATLEAKYGEQFRAQYGRPMTFLDGALPDQADIRSRDLAQFIREHPGAYARHCIQRLGRLWFPRSWSETFGLNADFAELRAEGSVIAIAAKGGMLLLDTVFLALAAGGMLLALREWRRFAPYIAVILLMTGLYAVMTATARFRVPLMPITAVFAAHSMSRLASVARARHTWLPPRGRTEPARS